MNLRNVFVAAGLMLTFTTGTTAVAQTRGPEITVGLASLGFETVDGDASFVQVFAPTAMLRLAFYPSPNIAIEPQFKMDAWSGEDRSSSLISLGVFVPYYFNGDQGATGLYAAPGLGITLHSNKDEFGVKDNSTQTFIAAEFGKKIRIGESAAFRLAGQYFQELANSDWFSFRNISAILGISVFLK